MPWHIIRTRFGYEPQLSWDGVTTLCPLERVHRSSRRPWLPSTITRPLFSGYLFASWDSTDFDLWHEITDTKGVLEILGDEQGEPWPVQEKDIAIWRDKMDADGVVPDLKQTLDELQAGFNINDLVEFTYGAWVKVQGVCLALDKITAAVNFTCLGRQTAVRVPVTCCVKAAGSCDSPLTRRFRRDRLRRRGRGGRVESDFSSTALATLGGG